MSTRAIRTIAVLFGLSLLLTACDPNEVMRLVSDQLIDQEAAAADPAAGGSRAGAATDGSADTDADAASGKNEEREFQARRGGSPEKKAPAEATDTSRNDPSEAARNAPADTAGDARAEEPSEPRRARRQPAAADSAPVADKPAATTPADSTPGGDGSSSAAVQAIEKEIFDTLNATRRQAGLAALSLSADMSNGARDWSCDMARSGDFRHADLRSAGVNGENIAWGYSSAAAVHEGWMNSSGHRRNRMRANWTEYGIGICEDDAGRLYYTERFR